MTDTDAEHGAAEARVAAFGATMERIREALGKVIVGQDAVLEQLLLTVLTGGHCLITGLPGTAKTLMVQALARTLGLDFKRIQFTPDLMPSDVTGTDVIDTDPDSGQRDWRFVPGPVFTNVLLADEINRTPPKTQSALLEAMAESSVTVRGTTHALAQPFVVLATQNPIELEGTYPLPEAQLDRFILTLTARLRWSSATRWAGGCRERRPAPTRKRCSTSCNWSGKYPSPTRSTGSRLRSRARHDRTRGPRPIRSGAS